MFQVYNKVIQLYMYICVCVCVCVCVFFFKFFPIIDYYKILNSSLCYTVGP